MFIFGLVKNTVTSYQSTLTTISPQTPQILTMLLTTNKRKVWDKYDVTVVVTNIQGMGHTLQKNEYTMLPVETTVSFFCFLSLATNVYNKNMFEEKN